MILDDLLGAARLYLLAALAVALLLAGAYCAGHHTGYSAGHADAQRAAREGEHRADVARTDSTGGVIVQAQRTADRARTVSRAARARVVVVDSGRVLVDHVPQLVPPALRPLVDVVVTDAAVIRADSGALAAVTADRDAWRTRALHDEAALAEERRRTSPRCGAKCGAVVGVLATVGAALAVSTIRHAARAAIARPVVARPASAYGSR